MDAGLKGPIKKLFCSFWCSCNNREKYRGNPLFGVHAAAVSFNKKKTISRLYKSMNMGKSPIGKLKSMEEKRIKKAAYNYKRQISKPKRRLFNKVLPHDKDYGEACMKPDLDDTTYNQVKNNFLANLTKTAEEREKIQKSTILQSECGEWMELRRSLLTASNFGRIIKRREDTSCVNIVKELLYKSSHLRNVSSIKHGRDSEKIALEQLSTQINKEIKKCGLFIDQDLPFLGATPDGLCEDQIVEVKCPVTAHKVGIEEAIRNKKISFWKKDKSGELEVNKNHNWYYQVQGQLHITQRPKCIFTVWANEREPLKVEVIQKDDIFWKTKMEKKLTAFYMDCLLPELVDPRHPRNMEIRNPSYIEEAIKKKGSKKRAEYSEEEEVQE
ncbi:hypothetical protein ABMA28_015880 [Loxostege sticticalis]|uniref:YqaJ viral recombinase domain-containing protein n=1 Tax=Loxostege sticticalis TaxID=481309 RepID=A0ABD0TBB9_LOXSC